MLQVTRPVERAVRAVPGVRSVRSTTSRGTTDISINFDWGHDMVNALLQVESAINQIKPDLPPGTRFTAKRMYPANYSGVIAYSLTSHKLSQVKLRDLAALSDGAVTSPASRASPRSPCKAGKRPNIG